MQERARDILRDTDRMMTVRSFDGSSAIYVEYLNKSRCKSFCWGGRLEQTIAPTMREQKSKDTGQTIECIDVHRSLTLRSSTAILGTVFTGTQVEFPLCIQDSSHLVHLPALHALLLSWSAGKVDPSELPQYTLQNVSPSFFRRLDSRAIRYIKTRW